MTINYKLLLGLSAVLMLGGVIFYFVEKNRLSDLESEYSEIEIAIESKTQSLRNQNLKHTVSYSDFVDFTRNCNESLLKISEIKDAIGSNVVSGLFFASASENLKKRIETFSETKKKFLYHADSTVMRLQPYYEKTIGFQKRFEKHQKNFYSTIDKTSDVEDFTGFLPITNKILKRSEALHKTLLQQKMSVDLVDASDSMFVWGLNYLMSDITQEVDILAKQGRDIEAVAELLKKYKWHQLRKVSENQGLYTLVNRISKEYSPIIKTIDYRIEPLNQTFKILEKPIINNAMLGTITGGASDMSTLDLIAKVDPSSAQALITIKQICDGIHSLNNEIRQIISVTDPYLESVQTFQKSRNREAQLAVIKKSPGLSNYLDSKANLFTPMTEKIDEAKASINKVQAATSRIRSEQAKRHIYDFTQTANSIINTAYTPFNYWQSYVRSVVSPLNDAVSLEAEYNKIIDAIRKGSLNNDKIRMTSLATNKKTENLSFNKSTRSSSRKKVLVSYSTKLSKTDHYNSSGKFLSDAPAIIQQDRANNHRFNKPDPEDESDSFFTTLERRLIITEYLHKEKLGSEMENRIIQGNPKIKVIVYQDHSIKVKILND